MNLIKKNRLRLTPLALLYMIIHLHHNYLAWISWPQFAMRKTGSHSCHYDNTVSRLDAACIVVTLFT